MQWLQAIISGTTPVCYGSQYLSIALHTPSSVSISVASFPLSAPNTFLVLGQSYSLHKSVEGPSQQAANLSLEAAVERRAALARGTPQGTSGWN